MADYLDFDRRTRFVGEFLLKVDGATMHYGLEARSPFLDHELWEFAASLPVGLRLHGGKLKAILRELVRRKIGERVARGRKRGFTIPVQRWLAGRWYRTAFETMSESLLAREGWIHQPAVLEELRAAAKGHALATLAIYALELWLRHETSITVEVAKADLAACVLSL